jgi:hypothetical protein
MISNKQQEFTLCSSPDNWCSCASELKNAFDILWVHEPEGLITSIGSNKYFYSNKSSLSRACFLLAGYAIENLLKGLLITEHPEYVSQGKLSKGLSHHNLSTLANKITCIKFNSNEQSLLSLLGLYLTNLARYPVPLNSNQLEIEKPFTADIQILFNDLYLKLDKTIYSLTKNGWEGAEGISLKSSFRSEFEILPENWDEMKYDELIKWRDNQNKIQ